MAAFPETQPRLRSEPEVIQEPLAQPEAEAVQEPLLQQEPEISRPEEVTALQDVELTSTNQSVSPTDSQTSVNLHNKAKQQHRNLHAKLDHSWFQEILAIAISAFAVAIIGFVLMRCDGKPVPQSFSLNATISALGTIAALASWHALGASISQLKWAWLSKRARNLDDVRLFDKGSRGELGAVQAVISQTLRGRFTYGYVSPRPLFIASSR